MLSMHGQPRVGLPAAPALLGPQEGDVTDPGPSGEGAAGAAVSAIAPVRGIKATLGSCRVTLDHRYIVR